MVLLLLSSPVDRVGAAGSIVEVSTLDAGTVSRDD
jgi:hypothetical protein